MIPTTKQKVLMTQSWENRFEQKLLKIAQIDKEKPGALLSLIPCRDEWDEFLEYIRLEWRYFNGNTIRVERPHCLAILFGGIAFYCYDENRFWPQFAQAVGSQYLPDNQKHEISEDFVKAARKLGLKIQQHEHSMDYVGSAVYHIGIPLSLWDGFLEICKWAWDNDWREMSDSQWSEAIAKRVHTRPRLRNFLTSNREAATEFIREMHDARRILTDDENLSINDLKQACLLRPEYFDDVPETAEFLRPSNPDSLFKDRARLIWDEDRARISLHLPAVSRSKLPATWMIGNLTHPASATADILPLNSAAFTDSLFLMLESSGQREAQRLSGIASFGLFDCERNKFVNPERETLPLGSYALLAREALHELHRSGFDDEENPANELCELEDGTPYHITRLWPIDKSAEVSFTITDRPVNLSFRQPLKIEVRGYVIDSRHTADSEQRSEWMKVKSLPLPCLAVPIDYFRSPISVLQQKFQVLLNGQASQGRWEKLREDEHYDFYVWHWLNELCQPTKAQVEIKSPEMGLHFTYKFEVLYRLSGGQIPRLIKTGKL